MAAVFETKRLSDQSTLYSSGNTMMKITHLGKGVSVDSCSGHSIPELAPYVIADCEALVREAGRALVFVDGRKTLQMTTAFREQMTAYFKEVGDKVVVHVLQNSKLLVMAVTIANLALRNKVPMYSDYAKWKSALDATAGPVDPKLIQLDVENFAAAR